MKLTNRHNVVRIDRRNLLRPVNVEMRPVLVGLRPCASTTLRQIEDRDEFIRYERQSP